MMILEKGREKFYTASLLTFHPSFHQHSKGRRNMIVGMGMVRDTKCSEEPGSITMSLWVGAEVSERQLLLVGDCRLTPQM